MIVPLADFKDCWEQGLRPESCTLLDLWCEWWAWMKANGLPLQDYQEQAIARRPVVPVERFTLASMAYPLTEHYENSTLKSDPPAEIVPIISAYKREMMELWGWPEWGYRGVKK